MREDPKKHKPKSSKGLKKQFGQEDDDFLDDEFDYDRDEDWNDDDWNQDYHFEDDDDD